MKLGRLQIKNFLLFEKVDVDLSPITAAAVIGFVKDDHSQSNGVSKSGFLESIFYALTGKCRFSSDKGLVRRGSDENMFVDLSFEFMGEPIRVKRGRKAGAAQLKVWFNGVEQGKNVAERRKILADKLVLSPALAKATWYFVQGEADSLTSADPRNRKEYLASIVSDSRYEAWHGRAKQMCEEADQQIVKIDEYLTSVREMCSNAEAYQTEMETWSGLTVKYADQISELEERVSSYRSQGYMEEQIRDLQADLTFLQAEQEKMHLELEALRDAAATLPPESLEDLEERLQHAQQAVNEIVEKWCKALCIQEPEQWASVPPNRLMGAQQEYATATAVVDQINQAVESSEGGESICDACGQYISEEQKEEWEQEKREELVEALTTQAEMLEQVEFWKETFSSIQSDITRVQPQTTLIACAEQERAQAKQAMEDYDRELERHNLNRDRILGSIRDLSQKRTEKGQKIEEYTQKLETIQDTDVDDVARLLHDKKQDHANAIAEYTRWQQIADQAKQAKQQAGEFRSALEGWQKERNIRQVVAKLFSRDGVPLHKTEHATVFIQHCANEILEQCESDLRVKINCTPGSSKKKGELEFLVEQAGVVQEYDGCSGGQKKLVDICIRLAIARLLSKGANVQYECLFLDEVMASGTGFLDAHARAAIIKLLRELRSEFRQIFVISHLPEVQQAFQHTIVIEFDGHVSTVKLVTN